MGISNTELAIFIVVVLALGITAIVMLVVSKKDEKWTCKEGGCERDIDGEYASKSECENKCDVKNTLSGTETTGLNSWYCDSSRSQCLPTQDGPFTTKEACQQYCSNNIPGVSTPYFPQSLILPRPYHWGYPYWRRHHRRRRRRHRD